MMTEDVFTLADLEEMGKKAVVAKYSLQEKKTDEKNEALFHAAESLIKNAALILAANQRDMEAARAAGMGQSMLDRLYLDENRIGSMADGIREVGRLSDPVGEVMEEFSRPNGLLIQKCRVPMGVIGIIYESRPNVTADAFALCFKAGNCVILKGGSDALCSNRAIADILRGSLEESGFPMNALQLIPSTDRSLTDEFMKMNRYVDVLIPRGGAGLISHVVQNSTVPVIETGTGNCHIYVDESADLEMAVRIILNAKTQRTGVCNACESLVIHEACREAFLPLLAQELKKKHVEMRGDEAVREVLPDVIPATQQDYRTEYLDYIISLKTVSGLKEAVAHINANNTGHSESIITNNREAAEYFLRNVDAACVYVNASTRFTDGFEFGFGAEIGISTQKLHARGPMGLRELTSYKYRVYGNGQIRE